MINFIQKPSLCSVNQVNCQIQVTVTLKVTVTFAIYVNQQTLSIGGTIDFLRPLIS
jgi:hypothetical protein